MRWKDCTVQWLPAFERIIFYTNQSAPLVQSRAPRSQVFFRGLELLVARRDEEVMLRLVVLVQQRSVFWRGPTPLRSVERARSAGAAAVVPNNCEPAT
jgi:hypothetical protein